MLADKRAAVRAAVAEKIGMWSDDYSGSDAAPAVDALTKALADSDKRVRREAAGALENFEAQAEPAVPSLIKLLADGDPKAQERAAYALGAIGPKAAPRRSDVFFGDLPGRTLAADRASCLGAEHGAARAVGQRPRLQPKEFEGIVALRYD
jgi:HEAT repeat protein